MSRSRPLLILCVIAVLAGSLLRPQTSPAQTTSPQPSDARTACASDVQKLCAGVPAGGGRVLACLKQHKDEVSDGCKQAILAAMGRSSGNAGSAASPAPAAAPTPAAAPPAPATASPGPAAGSSTAKPPSSTPSKPSSHAAPTAKAASGEHYFVMKQVKIIDQGLGQGKPAYDLLIPKDWQFKGAVNTHEAEGGCFGDWFSVFGDATSPDNSVEFQIAPQFTWQYMDDPAGQRQMQAQNQKDAQSGMKPCPVRAPIKAEEFLRKDMVPKCTKACKNTTVVSAEAFPQLEEMTRHQLGVPPAASGGNAGNTRIDAARVRIAFDDDKGQPAEGWMAAAIVVHTMPGGGRGAAYDWHAVNLLFFRTPKGKLDANDKLFKLIASTIHPEAEWQKWSNGVIASLYQRKQEELAKQAAMLAAFRAHVADVINGVTANQMAGANQAAFGQDQLIRGVQTFRDPATGGTLELSNQYDHAWLNGANEYVMSDEANFNPNGNLTGNWNQLEVVRPQP
jgi:cysteine rich repeat protein